MTAIKTEPIETMVRREMDRARLVDVHTHLYDPAIGRILLWGIDELLTYHYLVAETFRCLPNLPYRTFWKMPKVQQADLVWRELFVKRSPVSEATRGVLTVLQRLELDANVSTPAPLRRYFAGKTARGYADQVLKLAGIRHLYMTNDPLDPLERPAWTRGFERDPRFRASLRLDSALAKWPEPVPKLRALGYDVEEALSGQTMAALRKYLGDWCRRMRARYLAISLPPTFQYPENSPLIMCFKHAVLPVARERGIPLALMIGVKKLVNPDLRLAGDSVGQADIGAVERLALDYPDVRLLVTTLARENTHALCIAARKFRNITPFGCWWFLNNPSLIREITAMRVETLGLSFIPQHSDSRVLDQLIYKWDHSRRVIGAVLAEKYADLTAARWKVSPASIRRDIALLFPDI